MIWNRVQKRDQWGLKKYRERPEAEWLRLDVPALRIISDELWQAAHPRLERARDTYVRGPHGRLIARPSVRDLDTPYLLSGLARCGACNGPLATVTRDFKATAGAGTTAATTAKRGHDRLHQPAPDPPGAARPGRARRAPRGARRPAARPGG